MTSLIKWAPFFEPFENFDEFFKDSSMALASKGGLVPPVDMYETKDSVIVETTLPGADPKKVSVKIENGVLTIKGSCERKTEVDEKNYYRREIRSGQVFRQITLPKRIEDDKAVAAFENGILRVTIPKSPEAKAKAVKIDVKNTD